MSKSSKQDQLANGGKLDMQSTMNASMSLWGHWRRNRLAAANRAPLDISRMVNSSNEEQGAADGIFSRRSSGVSSDLAATKNYDILFSRKATAPLEPAPRDASPDSSYTPMHRQLAECSCSPHRNGGRNAHRSVRQYGKHTGCFE